MNWSDRFIGLPYAGLGRDQDGCDCWGLACIIYRQELGINLPDYLGYSSVEEQTEIASVVADAAVSPLWVPVMGTAKPFDIAIFRRGRLSTHVGIVIRHGIMIHMEGEDCAKVADYQSGCWKHRLSGYYRHIKQAVKYPVQSLPEVKR